MKRTIYAPEGLASENCKLAMNLYDGCIHGCRFCYVPLVRHIPRDIFHADAIARLTPLDIQLGLMKVPAGTVQLCFTCDPYQPEDAKTLLTRSAISELHDAGHPVSILTKAGALARRDFDLLLPGDSFGVTMTFLDEKDSRRWEPYAAPPEERMSNLMEAKKAGIDTYISLEPVMGQALPVAIIKATAGFTDHYKIGKLNYEGILPDEFKSELEDIDYKKLVTDAIDTAVVKYKRGVHIKSSLSMAAYGSPDGYKIGVQLP